MEGAVYELALRTGTCTTKSKEFACAGQALIYSRAITGKAVWVAVGALEVGLIAVVVLAIGTGTFPTERFEVAFAGRALGRIRA